MRTQVVTKQYRTETAHRLCDYDGKCAHLHGHSYLWEATFEGEVDDRGIIIDFSDVKNAMALFLEPLDHALVLDKHDTLLMPHYRHALDFATDSTRQRVIAFDVNPTAENFSRWLLDNLTEYYADTAIHVLRVCVWETPNSYAEAINVR